MKYLILLIFSLLLFACSNDKKVYWCGDHACINNKERESYFKKTMIVEIRDLSKQGDKSKSELEIIKKQAGLEQKKEIKNEKELTKQIRLEKKRRIKEQKELAKQARLEEKRRINEQKELAKQARLEEKRRIKEQKELAKQARLEEKRRINEEKGPPKQARLEEKRRIKEQKELAKQIRLEEKRRIQEEKELAKEIKLEEDRRIEIEKQIVTDEKSNNDIRNEEEKDYSVVEKIQEKCKHHLTNAKSNMQRKAKIAFKDCLRREPSMTPGLFTVLNKKNFSVEEAVLDVDNLTFDTSSTKFKQLVEKITEQNSIRSYPDINDIPN